MVKGYHDRNEGVVAFIILGFFGLLAWQALAWLRFAAAGDFDPLMIYGGFAFGCWPGFSPPDELAMCHDAGTATLARWLDETGVWLGVSTVVVWFSELWLGFYVIARGLGNLK